MLARLEAVIKAGSVDSKKDLEKLVGELGFCSNALYTIKPMLRPLQCLLRRVGYKAVKIQLDGVLIEVLRVMRAAIASNRARRFPTSPHRGKRAILRVDASVQGFGGTLKLIGGADDLGSGRLLAHG